MPPFSKMEDDLFVDSLDALLPQSQCGQCSFPGCRPYAAAIASGEADINQCPPGGETTIAALAELLGCDRKPLNTKYGVAKPRRVAIIDEVHCIGCTLCLQVCPVDAILGTTKQMHTVISNECTGCELCISPCPVDCIDMVPISGEPLDNLTACGCCTDASLINIPSVDYYQFTKTESAARDRDKQKADVARSRYKFRLQRLEREKLERAARYDQKKAALTTAPTSSDYGNTPASGSVTDSDSKQAAVLAAIARAQARHAAAAEPLSQPEALPRRTPD